ncbi:MAG TPA: polysaccharide deacetylase family protein [Solirubrobacteraceae bacterium]|nr:polysaccharide deacetylase family protein [Solirubrobacteraceae bacterium]
MHAIVLTFDNLGEASALHRGTADPAMPLGRDPSVTEALPRLLDELATHQLRATFFVEAINCELNPEAVRSIAAAGHELGVHGYSHEPWSELTASEEPELLERSTAAFAALGITARAFRPPGGALTARTPALLREHGYAWCSPLGATPALCDGLAVVPFDWELVDAFHLMDRFADLRRRRGEDPGGTAPAELAARLVRTLAGAKPPPTLRTLILHPFLMLDDAWWQGVRRLLAHLARLSREGEAWVVPGADFARWLREAAP